MKRQVVGRWIGRIGVWVPATALWLGCPADPHTITDPASQPAFNFPVAGAFVQPAGSFNLLRIPFVFDTAVADAFARATPGNRSYFTSTLFGCCGGWDLSGRGRNSTNDRRLPAISDNNSAVATAANSLVILDPSGLCATECAFHNPFTNGATLQNLTPNTVYIVALFRYGITINGQLDANNAALGRPPDAADELVLVGGTPQGDPTVPIVAFPTIVPLVADANPMVLGNFTSSATGTGAFDVVIDGTGLLYSDISGNPPDAAFDSSLVARNDDTPTTFPRYNYLVILEGPATDAADAADNPQALRIQIGQDFLASTGALVNNAYAPYPLQIPTAQLAGRPGFLGAKPDSMRATFNSLEALAGAARYEAWLVNPGTGAMVPARGRYNLFQIIATRDPITGDIVSTRDSLVDSIPSTASFVGGNTGDGFRHQLILSDASLGGGAADSIGLYTHLMLTVDGSPGDGTPSNARPFWFQFTDQKGTPTDLRDDSFTQSGSPLFGTFNASTPTASIRFGGQGRGLGGIRENVLSVDIENVSRPPIGYSLVGWITGSGVPPVRFQDITGPLPEAVSLVDADVTAVPGLVTATGILDANLRLLENVAGINFDDYTGFVLTLEPKLGDAAIGPLQVLVGTLPQ